MISPTALLGVAKDLAELDRTRPRQASLRRAVSTAYYAVFHLLIQDSVRALVGQRQEIREVASRWFSHTQMASACGFFQGSKVLLKHQPVGKGLAGIPVSQELQDVARAFQTLQQARHEADYDMSSRRFTRQSAQQLVEQAEQAFADWQTATVDPWRPLLMLLMLTGDSVIKTR